MMAEKEKNTQQLILKAAEEEFMEKGFDGARTVSIAARAGVTHAMLHYYFRTKEQLFSLVVKDKIAELIESCLSIFEDNSLPLAERIEKGISAHFDFLLRNPRMPWFMVNELGRVDIKQFEPYLPKVIHTLKSVSKEIEVDVPPIHIFIDVLSQNIFPFLLLPVFDKGLIDAEEDRTAFLEQIRRENITVIRKRLGL